jgi:DNA polymerase-3 subunit gamma/tau
MAYQSLYRKWRPQTFAAMVGQEHVARTLANAVRDERMAHAYLFTGPRGTGKTSAARLFAKAINCPQRVGAEPCDRCDSCVAIREGRSLDVLEIDGASNRGIDEIRELRERVGMAATTGRFRFYIIDEVHQLTEAAFNALLKTLEEPPAHVIFILATTDAHKVPATISSRCQHFSFHRHSAAGTRARLKEVAAAEAITLEPAALEQLVQVADGSLRDALSVLDQAVAFCGPEISGDQLTAMLGLVPQAAVVEFAGYLRDRDIAGAVRMPNRLAEEGADLRQFNQQLITHLRGLLAEQSAGARGAGGGQTWELAHLLATIRAFAAVDFSARLTMIPQLPLELAAVEACVLPAVAAPAIASTAPARASRAETAAAVPERPAPRSGGGVPERNGAPASRVPPADDDAILQAPAVVAAAGFERNPIAAATVPDDLRRRWERTLVKLRPISSKAQGMCNSAQLLGIDGHTLVLSAKGITFVRDSLNDQRLRSTVEPVIEEIFGQKLGLRCELNGMPLGAAENTVATAAGPAAAAGVVPTEPTTGAATKRPPTVPEPQPAVIPPDPATVPPTRDLAAEAANNMTVRMAMDAFGARIESVIPAEDSRRAR